MRALVLVHTFPSRTQTFVLNQVLGLLRLGCDVHVLAKQSDSPDATLALGVWPAGYLQQRISYLAGAPYARAAGWRRLARSAMRAIGYSLCHPMQAARAVSVAIQTGDFSCLQGLSVARRLGRSGRYDVVHCQFGSIANMALVLRRCGAVDAPIVVSFRGSDLDAYLRRKPRAYELLKREGARFLPVCSAFAETLRRLGFPAERTEVHFSGINVHRFPFQAREAPSGRPLRLIAIGRMVGKKGFRHVVEAMGLLVRAGRLVTLTMVGDGPERRRLEEMAQRSGVGAAVQFRGSVPHHEIPALLAVHDVLVAPSVTDPRGDREGIPNVLKEAMACGLPVIATRHSGIPDLVEDGKEGFLVPEGDPAAIAARIEMLLDRPELWRGLSAAARAKVERLFDIGRLSERLAAIYAEVAASGVRAVSAEGL